MSTTPSLSNLPHPWADLELPSVAAKACMTPGHDWSICQNCNNEPPSNRNHLNKHLTLMCLDATWNSWRKPNAKMKHQCRFVTCLRSTTMSATSAAVPMSTKMCQNGDIFSLQTNSGFPARFQAKKNMFATTWPKSHKSCKTSGPMLLRLQKIRKRFKTWVWGARQRFHSFSWGCSVSSSRSS